LRRNYGITKFAKLTEFLRRERQGKLDNDCNDLG
jgi:hypothetical protein